MRSRRRRILEDEWQSSVSGGNETGGGMVELFAQRERLLDDTQVVRGVIRMATPRDIVILWGISVSVAAIAAHIVFARLSADSPSTGTVHSESVATAERYPTLADGLAIGAVVLSGIVSLATPIRRHAGSQILHSKSTRPGRSGRGLDERWRRFTLILGLWTGFSVTSYVFMLRRPPADSFAFCAMCILLLLPLRVYLRHGDRAEWVPWIMGCSWLTLVLTREPTYVFGPVFVGLLGYTAAILHARKRRDRA
jgi:hypothetical protein